jgi:signal transduction histidine kinase/FixJ family two-component response regulator
VSTRLRVLIVDDSRNDAELVALELRRHGYEPSYERVDTSDDMVAALAQRNWQLVISDYSMPSFNGLAALKRLQDSGLDIPFILVSGNIGEETAVEAMKAGAHDYVLKHNLARLAAAVTRELREAEIRREHARAIERDRVLARSARLSESLNYETTLSNVTRWLVPGVADWCCLGLIDESGTLRQVGPPTRFDHDKTLMGDLIFGAEGLAGPPPVLASVLRDGKPLVFEAIPPPMIADLVRDPARVALFEKIEMKSVMCLPLIAQKHIVGMMLLVTAESGRRYSQGDLEFGSELARRCMTAIEHARLYAGAKEAIEARDEFLSVASHELRTPLTTLQLLLTSTERAITTAANVDFPRELKVRIAKATKQSERLGELIDTLLDVSKIATGRMSLDLEEFDIADLVGEAVLRLDEDLKHANCTVEMRVRQRVRGRWDRLRLDQVITNLLSNAIKFGAGKPIEITVEMNDALASISVQDHGIGVSRGDLDRIFGRFERAVSTRNYGGLGLGLYVARRIVEAHGGSISAASEPGAGAIFSVRLPVIAA